MELNSDFSNMKITYIRTPVVSFTTVQCLMAELQAKTFGEIVKSIDEKLTNICESILTFQG